MRRPLVIALCALLVLPACGGGDDEAPPSEPLPAIDVAAALAAAPVAVASAALDEVTEDVAAIAAAREAEGTARGQHLRDAAAARKRVDTDEGRVTAQAAVRPQVLAAGMTTLDFSTAAAQLMNLAGGSGQVVNPTGKDVSVGGADANVGYTLDVSAAGAVTTTITSKVDLGVLGVTAGSSETITGNTCPDAQGTVSFTVTVRTGARGGSKVYDKTVSATVRATVDDTATTVSSEVDTTSETRSQADGREVYVETKGSFTVEGGEPRGRRFDVTRSSSQATSDDRARLSSEGDTNAYAVGLTALSVAEGQWQNGLCVSIDAASPGSVDPGSSTTVKVALRLRGGGQADAPVKVALDGGESVSAEEVKPTPGSFVYVAPSERDKEARITLSTVSRRGKDRRVLDASTAAKDLKIDAPYGFARIAGVKCGGPAGAWQLRATADQAGAKVVEDLRFTLTEPGLRGALGGTRTVTAAGRSFSFPETGTVTYDVDGKVLTIATVAGTVPIDVSEGSYCQDGKPAS